MFNKRSKFKKIVRFSFSGCAYVALGLGVLTALGLGVAQATGWWQGLGWSSNTRPHAYFHGQYVPIAKQAGQAIPPLSSQGTTITSKGVTDLDSNGNSVLHQHVVVLQPGRIIWADKGIIYRDKKLGKVTHIRLVGHVVVFEPSRMATAPYAIVYPGNNKLKANGVTYRMDIAGSHSAMWGRGKHFSAVTHKYWDMRPSTYSTCAPDRPCWQIHAKHMHVDKVKQRITATQVWLGVHHIPIFYSPYLSFSLNHQRKTGFLIPQPNHTTASGYNVGLPFYWNMAPNYDMMLTTSYSTKRHLKENVLFHHLNTWGSGIDNFYILPHDKAFAKFRQQTLANPDYPVAAKDKAAYLKQLKNNSARRWWSSMNENVQVNDKISAILNENYVSDPYLLRDFSSNSYLAASNQLFNRGMISYQGDAIQAAVLAQGFQVLHPINGTVIANQYARLPEFDLGAQKSLGNFNFAIDTQWVRFAFTPFLASKADMVVGPRMHLRPKLSWFNIKSWGFFNPEVQYDIIAYQDHSLQTKQKVNPTRTLPMFDIDSGLYLEQRFHVHGHHYIQYIEPRLYYLYVPYKNQDRLPLFASSPMNFTYPQLFADNSFGDYDRIQNANQLTMAIESTINNDTGVTKWQLGTGIIRYFSPQKVTGVFHLPDAPIKPPDPNAPAPPRFSPWATQITYYFGSQWSSTLTSNYNIEQHHLDNIGLSLSYLYGDNHILTTGYNYVYSQAADPNSIDYDTKAVNYRRINLGYAWPLTAHWRGLGYIGYDLGHKHVQQYFLGLGYEDSCWALRFVYNKFYLEDTKPTQPPQYQHQYFFELVFKGLTSMGNDPLATELLSPLPGYKDNLGEMR